MEEANRGATPWTWLPCRAGVDELARVRWAQARRWRGGVVEAVLGNSPDALEALQARGQGRSLRQSRCRATGSRFPTSNELRGHRPPYVHLANAWRGIAEITRRRLRGVLDAAISVHLDRSSTPARLPGNASADPSGCGCSTSSPAKSRGCSSVGGVRDPGLRENRNFTDPVRGGGVQRLLAGSGEEVLPLIAAARYRRPETTRYSTNVDIARGSPGRASEGESSC